MKRYVIFALAALLMLAAWGCTEKSAEAPELLVPVGAKMDTVVAAIGTMEDMIVLEGAVAPRVAELHFTHDSRIGNIPVSLGQSVKAGDILVEIDVSQIDAALAALGGEANEIAEATAYEEKLYDIDMEILSLELSLLTDEMARYDKETDIQLRALEYENAAAAREERLTAIDEARAAYESQREGISLAAPTDGRVAYIGVSPGQTAKAYDTVCVVTDDSALVLQTDYISAAALEGAVEIYALIDGVRHEITPEPVDEDEYARAALKGIKYLSTFALADTSNLTPGQTAAVVLVTARLANALKIPVNALFEDDGGYYVYATQGETRTRRDVRVGLMTATEAEILSGLSEGEVVYVGN